MLNSSVDFNLYFIIVKYFQHLKKRESFLITTTYELK